MTSLTWNRQEDGSEWSSHRTRVLAVWPIDSTITNAWAWAVFEGETGRDVARGQAGNLERARFTAKYAAENRKADVVRPLPKQPERTRTTPNPYARRREDTERWWSRPSPSGNGNWHVGTGRNERIVIIRGETSVEAEALAIRVRDLLNGEKP